MNVNIRETSSHVEFEPSSYYAAFSCELEASAYPMWSIISHLKDTSYAQLSKKIMNYLITSLQDWLDAVNFQSPRMEKTEMMHASFHFPLHRYLAAFIYQAIKTMNISLNDILPDPEIIKLFMMHPLRVQVSFKSDLLFVNFHEMRCAEHFVLIPNGDHSPEATNSVAFGQSVRTAHSRKS